MSVALACPLFVLRIRFHSQELVFFRADMQSRMRRLCRLDINTSETEILFKHMAMTMLQQGNLCPLPLSVQPVYWEFDQALRLYSTPQAVRPRSSWKRLTLSQHRNLMEPLLFIVRLDYPRLCVQPLAAWELSWLLMHLQPRWLAGQPRGVSQALQARISSFVCRLYGCCCRHLFESVLMDERELIPRCHWRRCVCFQCDPGKCDRNLS